VEWALSQGKTLLCQEVGKDPLSIIFAQIHSPYRELGVLCLARSGDQEPFSETELYLADALALAVAVGIDSFDHLLNRQQDLLLQTLTTLTQLVNLRADRVSGHAARVTEYALLMADKLGVSEMERYYLKIGAPLHDLGMFGIQDAIVQKPGPLSPKEKVLMQSHVAKGVALLESLPSLTPLVPILRNHHEHWDGTGYPDGLAGADIPLLPRIVAVADAFDAMTSDRPFRPGRSLKEAFQELERKSGVQFDPDCVRALQQVRPQIEEQFMQRNLLTNTCSWSEMKKTLETSLGNARPQARTASQL
jgi:HD-GYP domain-containing protein (c-di-GMP phosphodiesterase class II)